jgi:hypothetical protein
VTADALQPRRMTVPVDRIRNPGEAALLAGLVTCAAVFYLVPWVPVDVVALAGIGALAWLRLDLALALMPLFVPFFMAPKHIGSKHLPPSEVFLSVDLLIGLAILAVRGGLAGAIRRVTSSPFFVPAVWFVAAGAASTALAADRGHAVQWYVQLFLEPIVYFALLLVFCNGRSWYWLVAGVVCAGVVSGVIGLGQYVTGQDLTVVPGTTVERIHALYDSPVNLGLLFDRSLPLSFGLLLAAPLGRQVRAALLTGVIVMLGALALTNSSGAWLGVGFGMLVVLSLTFGWGRYLLLACGLVLIAALAVKGPSVVHVFRGGQTATTQYRLAVWDSAWRMAREHPIFGIGPDNFIHYYAPRHDPYMPCVAGLGYLEQAAANDPCLSHPHNLVLDFWLSAGLLGLATGVWLQFAFWRLAVVGLRQASGARRAVALGAAGAMAASLVHGLVDNFYFLMDLSILFWLLCACVWWASEGASPRARSAT